ncbi:PAS domain S-box protein [Flavobacterium sp. SUN046]|uniref:PAS domain S-box protein n=1 Tax=Flavobacterium sp. SUN046 TaxID=3002440 RepID=UPI002DBE7A6D|nr:PAS domain S-box protein [Flavobacterium sp. SUN046]MEC4050468.1 PAS domain S-box protein [Flavobacterium sp. SUN046]
MEQKELDSRIVSLSARQRSLSQKIIVLCLEQKESPSQTEYSQKLQQTIERWKKVHYGILNGDSHLEVPATEDPLIKNYLKTGTPRVEWIVANRNRLTKIPIKQLINNQNAFLKTTEKVVLHFQNSFKTNLFRIKLIEIILAFITLQVILLEFFFFIRPIIFQLEQQKKENEKTKIRLNAILDSSSDSNILIDINFKILSLNKVASNHIESVWDIIPQIGDDMLKYVSGDSDNSFKENFEACFKGATIQIEKKLSFADGVYRWYEITYFPVRDNYNNLIGAAFNAKDIHLRKQQEKQINAQIEALKKIAWQYSHELRSPLTNILGLTNFIQKKKQNLNSEEQTTYLSKINESALKIDTVIHTIVHEIESQK